MDYKETVKLYIIRSFAYLSYGRSDIDSKIVYGYGSISKLYAAKLIDFLPKISYNDGYYLTKN